MALSTVTVMNELPSILKALDELGRRMGPGELRTLPGLTITSLREAALTHDEPRARKMYVQHEV